MSIEHLVDVGGARVVEHAAFGARTTYRVGGTVRALVTLSTMADLDELGPIVESSGLRTYVIGNGSNLLVADGELDVIGLRLVSSKQLAARVCVTARRWSARNTRTSSSPIPADSPATSTN